MGAPYFWMFVVVINHQSSSVWSVVVVIINHATKGLKAPQRQLLELRYGPKSSIEEIAVSLERSAGSIRQALYRIREALLACIERRLATEAGT